MDVVSEGLITEVSPNDAMRGERLDLAGYLANGRSALDCVRRGLTAAGAGTPTTILDFACGHGRVLRHLKAAFPDAALTACDVNEDGVAFCAETFGASGVVATEDPQRIRFASQFDLIWVGSLLTHLDARRWREFLALFESLLTLRACWFSRPTVLTRRNTYGPTKPIHGSSRPTTKQDSGTRSAPGDGLGYGLPCSPLCWIARL